ncbi:GntR family transcriptional regulator [Lactiplantibacillus modestisalitolerans]|uniref:GntR family transcriptional regulator n=1 Tax=Lactiplantibacillus modestisalitolerans TaxID=1457219 RepID=A0ABV5WVV0_9LACO|nr:GntR family transcriptional regulator [Lactiplantibacillus modestisalitolerans]
MVEVSSYQDEAYIKIRDKILRMKFIPGERINKKALQKELSIGATPMREAFLRLSREGLLLVRPQSGTYVSKISIDEVYQARFVRESIEKLVIAEAITRLTSKDLDEFKKIIALQELYLKSGDYDQFFNLDEAFHRTFYKIDHKEFVWQWLQVVNLQFNRFRYFRLEETDLDWQQICDDHRAIVKAVADKRTQRAETAISRHLHMVDEDIKTALKHHPEYFE